MQQRVKETLAREGMQYLMSQKKKILFGHGKVWIFISGGGNLMGSVLYWIHYICWILYARWGLWLKTRGLTFPDFHGKREEGEDRGIVSLVLENPVKNDVLFDDRQHLCFLTGPNMAGKSTCMKAFGVAVYLAHCGLPVPAARMELSVFKGIVYHD